MPDIVALAAAKERFIKEPSLPHRLIAEIKQMAWRARADHLRGYAAIDAELANGLGRASQLPAGAEQLLGLESLHRQFEERVAEAEAEVARQAKAHFQRNLDIQVENSRGQMRRQWNDAALEPVRVAVELLVLRLDEIGVRMGKTFDDDGMLGRISDIEDALTAARTAIGLERRAARLRVSNAAADRAVAEAMPAAA